MTTQAATSYRVPTFLALLMHALVLSSVFVIWTKPIEQHEYKPPPVVKAKLVTMEAPKLEAPPPKATPPPPEAKPTPPEAKPTPPEAKPTPPEVKPPPPEEKPAPLKTTAPPEVKQTPESTPRDAPKSAEPVPPVAKLSPAPPLAKRSTPMAPQPLAKSAPPPAMPPAPRPSPPVAVKSAPAAAAEAESLSLRFTSDTDFLKLVSSAVIEVYAYDAATVFKLSPGLTFAPAARPPQVHVLLAETIPSLVREALVRTASGDRPLVWGVRLPPDIESSIERHLAQERTGVLLIDRKGSVHHVASKSPS